jgi:protein gp37
MCGAEYDKDGNMTKKPWCYAYRLNERYKWIPDWRSMVFKPEQLAKLNSKKGKAVFANSMSDVCYWRQEWIDAAWTQMLKNPQHAYLFLTKDGDTASKKVARADSMIEREYAAYRVTAPAYWLGQTHTIGVYEKKLDKVSYLSVEPMHGEVTLSLPYDHNNPNSGLEVVIIGAETGSGARQRPTKKEWVQDLVKQCDIVGISVFMKESLRKIMGDGFRTDELPWYRWLTNERESDKIIQASAYSIV